MTEKMEAAKRQLNTMQRAHDNLVVARNQAIDAATAVRCHLEDARREFEAAVKEWLEQ